MSDSITIDGVGPMPVERPATVAELCTIVRRCAESKTAIYPAGGGTMLDYGMPPARLGIALSTTALNQVIDYPARDLTITVRAGITMQKLQETLAAENQWLPIDVPAPEQATIGGVIACDVSGPRRYGYGTLRDYIIGITVVNDRGEECKAGGRVVKNVAGYDMMKLHTGALGTLGVITQVTLRVKPRPEVSAVVMARCSSAELNGAMEVVFSTQTRPIAAELQLTAKSPAANWEIMFAFEGSREAVDWQAQCVAGELAQAGLESVGAVDVDKSVFDTSPTSAAALLIRVSLPRTGLADYIRRLTKLPAGGRLRASVGNGILEIGYPDILAVEFAEAIAPALVDSAEVCGGNVEIGRCKPDLKKSRPIWGRPPADLALQKAVKRALDPQNLFNPGRFVTDCF